MIEELVASSTIKPAPKSHLFLNKLRKISSIDRDIRKKWGKLQKQKMEAEQQHFREMIDVQRLRQLREDMIKHELQNSEPYPHRVNKIRSEIIRQEVHLRKKHNEEIFFRKKERKPKLQLSPPPHLFESPQPLRKFKTEPFQSPLMLEKRGAQREKELKIIQFNYEEDLKRISSRRRMNNIKIAEGQKEWLRKKKGSKCYYRLISSFHPPFQ